MPATVPVSTPAELTAAISAAQPGDTIVLAAGTYAMTGATCAANGTAAQPITVKSATPLAAVIQMDALEGFKVSGAYWHFEDIDVRGVCANDSDCEHAFHVFGAADGFVLRGSRVRDFNAQLKVNAAMVNGAMVQPDRGLVEYNEVGDTRGRNTSNPVTKLNMDTGDDWIVRGNYLHDAYKLAGDNTSYAAFMKSGGHRGLYERNLVLCSKDTTGGTRIGLSFGGGGTGAQYCAPAYDPNVPCSIEHYDGTMRNNIIANCSDVGIYLNRGQNSHILYNTIIGTGGVDFRFDTTSGEAVGNVLTSVVRTRDGATMTPTANHDNVAVSQFQSWYRDPVAGDLAVVGDVSSLVGAGPARADVPNDYCGVTRPAGMVAVGAIEHSVMPACDTTRPPMIADPPPVYGDGVFGDDGGTTPASPSGGCCETSSRSPRSLPLAFAVLLLLRRRRR